jgi:predicted methyltransferase
MPHTVGRQTADRPEKTADIGRTQTRQVAFRSLSTMKSSQSSPVNVAWLFALLAASLTFTAHAQSEQETRMRAALAAPDRAEENRVRDAARRPVQVIQFVGIQTGMTVLDVIAAGGWYTEVLSAAVGPSGQVIAHNPAFFISREGFLEAERERHARLGNVRALHGDIADGGINGTVDAAISALNLHDTYNGQGEDAAVALVRQIFDALKPGGVFGLIDHRGDAGQDNQAFHRMQVSQARDVLTRAGFVVEAESEILANPADSRRNIRDPELERNTDRFLLRARKPGS